LYRSSPFSRLAKWTARAAGHPAAFVGSVTIIIFWAILGPICHYSDTWQLVINTGTTIVTFLMIFLVQNTQNRNSAAIQLKLDEIIRATEGAYNALLDLEELTEKDLYSLRDKYEALAQRARANRLQGLLDIDTPDVD